MLAFPNSKINIGLNIIGKRSDGFHNIETVFYPIKLCDCLEILPEESFSPQPTFTLTGIDLGENNSNNLCLKAYQLLSKEFNLPSVKMHLHKIIPIGAGLGGGSSDAACVLKMLNYLFNLKLSSKNLTDFATKLGSDCAFFIENRQCLASGRGELIQEVKLDLSRYHIALVKPDIHSSTAGAYSGVTPAKPENPLSKLIQEPIETWKNNIKNDFEKSVFNRYPILAAIKNDLYNQGAIYAAMSGSGSAIYGIFRERPELALFKQYFTYINVL